MPNQFNLRWPSPSLLPLTLAFLIVSVKLVDCSRGDRDYTFHNCMTKCREENCSNNGTRYKNQPVHLEYLGWDCQDECKYHCMWNTVKIFETHKLDIPQFFGKWPFIRLFGIQEPASVLASLLNLAAHLHGIIKFRSRVPADAPLFWFWHVFAGVCLNGWVCSTIFHSRDTAKTELMDYFSAFLMVLFSLLAAAVRMFQKVLCMQVMSISVLFCAFYLYHIYYLAFIRFDYGYNMMANITIGILNAAVWLVWCGLNRKVMPHVWKCALFIILAVASILLEVGDFQPLFWVLDAHALWHFSTALISPIWYSFIIDDSLYLRRQAMKSKNV